MGRILLAAGILLIGFWGIGLITIDITSPLFHSLVFIGTLLIAYEIYRAWRKKP